MRFDNTLKTIALVSLFTLSACSQKMQLPEAGQKVALQPSAQFVPTQKYNEESKLVPYETVENPYLAEKTKINKGSVLLFIEAKKAMRAEDFKTAEQKLSVITKKDPELSGPWVLLGHLEVERENFKKAEELYQKAIRVNPDNVNAYIALAKAQRLMGEFHVAQNTLVLALKLWPDFPEAHLNIAILYDLYLNQAEKAQMHYEAYLFLDDYKDPQAIAWYKEVLERTQNFKSYVDSQAGFDKIKQAMANNLPGAQG
ncbi:tetratricopeptide repeat protein [Bermanella marisrubri]|nr:tetratricopeptide repeat protein [Bermanella marisrubri]QIZ83428.1 tetratricopeptide repeat protein [Bermanella marisrubri]